MKTYDVVIGQGIGPIQLGMPCEEAEALLGEYEPNNFQPYGRDYTIHEDISEDFIVSYDKAQKVNFICFTNSGNAALTLDGEPLSEWSCCELFIKFHELDPEMEFDSEGFTSDALGFGMTFRSETLTDENSRAYTCDVVDTLQVATKNYWKEY